MSHHDIKGIKIEDSRIADLTQSMDFVVYSGGQNSTYQPFPFNSASNTSLVANLQIPSEAIVSDAKVLFQSDLNLTFNLANVPAGQQCFALGLTDSLNSFPLQSLFSTCSLQINNANSSTNYADILPFIKLLEDKNRMEKADSTSPDYINQNWGRYSDAVLTNSNPMASYNESTFDNTRIPNGAYPYSYYEVRHYIAGVYTDSSLISTSTSDTWIIYLSYAKLTEPFLCLSPFVNNDYSVAGLLGINNIALTLNINQCQKVWATGNSFVNSTGTGLTGYITNISLGNPQSNNLGFTNSKLLFNFLTLTDLQYSKVSTKSVTSYIDYPRYISPASNSPTLAPNQSGTVSFANIQISQIPNLLVFALRVPLSQQNWCYSDSFMKINSVSITFNNSSGLLSSANSTQLYTMSVESGSTQSFYSFNGSATAIQSGSPVIVPTLGSMICINPSKFLSLNPLLSNSSIGQFNLQINVNVTNNQNFSFAPEGVTLCVNAGYMISEIGNSSFYTAVLDRQLVLETKASDDQDIIVDEEMYKNSVGGKLHKGSASVSKFLRHTKGGKKHHKQEKHMSKSKLHKLLK